MKYLTFVLVTALAGPGVLADTRLTMEQSDDQTVTVVNVRDGKVAFEEGGAVMAIYDSQSGSITQVDHKNRQYITMDAQMMDEVASQMSAAMKQMEAQLASMPAEQREAIMKMMPGMDNRMNGGEKKTSVEVDWTGDRTEVAGYRCEMAKVIAANGAVSKACIAKHGELGISDADFDAMTAMFASMQEMASRMGTDQDIPDPRAMGGIPIRMTDPDGKTTEVTSVSNDDLAGAMFEVPAGYEKKSITGGM